LNGDPNAIDLLVAELGKLPGVGEKTARRFAFHILNAPESYARDLSAAVLAVRERVRLCSVCCDLTEVDPCPVCRSQQREQATVCVVERPTDVIAIERTGEYRGHYHVLHGVINPLEGIGPDDIKLRQLVQRLHDGAVSEVIVATNPSVNGEATANYIVRLLRPLAITVSRIALGVPMGADIEFADKVTLGRALAGRRPL
jgi:recombination protein RecR